MALRAAVILTLIVTAVPLSACSGASHATATVAGTAPPKKTLAGHLGVLTRAQALAFARAVNLTAHDIPGFTANANKEEHEGETPSEKHLEHELQRCTKGALGTQNGVAEASSKEFVLKRDGLGFSVHSQVSVARTAALAAKELAAIRTSHTRGCLSRYIDLLLEEQLHNEFRQQKLPRSAIGRTSVSIVQGTPPSHRDWGSFGWRILATVTLGHAKLPFYLDILGFVDGPAEVSLWSTGTLRSFPAAGQEHLYRLLLGRAEAYGHHSIARVRST